MRGCFGQQTIFGGDLVLRPRHQRFVDQGGGGRERAFDAGDRDIEIIEGADRNHARDAALGRIRIDVIEALEVGRVFDVTKQRQRMPPGQLRLRMGRSDHGCGRDAAKRRGDGGEGAALQKVASGNRQRENPVAVGASGVWDPI